MSTTDEDGGSIETARLATTDAAALAGAAEGDDIVVVPAAPENAERLRRRRAVYALAGLAVAVLIVGAIALVAHENDTSTATVRLNPPTTVATKPISETHPTATNKKAVPVVVVTTVPPQTVPPQTVPPQTAATAATSPPATAPVVAPTTAVTKQYGVSRLTWTAPRTLRIASGASAALAVTAHNPTDGTITLPHPLACTPRLDHAEMCTEMVQLISSGQSASAQFTIDATDIAPGSYTLSIERALTVAVTVT